MSTFRAISDSFEVALCWPNDMPSVDHRDDSALRLFVSRDWDATMVVERLDTECLAPVWTVTDLACVDAAHTRCRCGVVELADALTLLHPSQHAQAVHAQSTLIASLVSHTVTARRYVALSPGDRLRLPDGEFCPACLLADRQHLAGLEDEVLERTRELSAATAQLAAAR